MSDTQTDTLFAKPLVEIQQFKFDENVAAVFPDMLKRSIPGYDTILTMIRDLAERYGRADSHCYDLGCSLGAVSLAMAQGLKAKATNGKEAKATKPTRIIAIDNSKAMIERCQQNIAASELGTPIDAYCEDIAAIKLERASMVVLNFTLQFIPLAQRGDIIQSIFDGMLPGGILLISEKLAFDNAHHQDLMTELYHHFKQANGYSELEVAQKRSALEQVLQAETLGAHTKRLTDAGFKHVDLWFQCFNFASLIAIKP